MHAGRRKPQLMVGLLQLLAWGAAHAHELAGNKPPTSLTLCVRRRPQGKQLGFAARVLRCPFFLQLQSLARVCLFKKQRGAGGI